MTHQHIKVHSSYIKIVICLCREHVGMYTTQRRYQSEVQYGTLVNLRTNITTRKHYIRLTIELKESNLGERKKKRCENDFQQLSYSRNLRTFYVITGFNTYVCQSLNPEQNVRMSSIPSAHTLHLNSPPFHRTTSVVGKWNKITQQETPQFGPFT